MTITGKKGITVTVEPDGKTSIEAFGYTGHDCLAATAALERALGSTTGRKMKQQKRLTAVAVKR